VSRPLRIEHPGSFYHVTSGGNERKMVFEGVEIFWDAGECGQRAEQEIQRDDREG